MYLDIYVCLDLEYNRELSFFHLALSRLTVLFFLFFSYLFFLLHPRRALLSLSSFLLRLLYLSFTAIFFTAPHIIPLFAPSSTTSNHRRHSTLFSTLHFLVFRFFSLYPTHVIVPSFSLSPSLFSPPILFRFPFAYSTSLQRRTLPSFAALGAKLGLGEVFRGIFFSHLCIHLARYFIRGSLFTDHWRDAFFYLFRYENNGRCYRNCR